jgi:hypothetical protein
MKGSEGRIITTHAIAGSDGGLSGRPYRQLAWQKPRALAEGAELASTQFWHE